jgi:ribosomal protein L5
MKQTQVYNILFSKSFFFDKFSINNVYQYPQLRSIELKISSKMLQLDKYNFIKMIFLFYLITGQKSRVLIQTCNILSFRRKKVIGLSLTIHDFKFVLDFLIKRQLALLPFFQCFGLRDKSVLTFNFEQKVQDDDILFQLLNLTTIFKYQITLKSTSIKRSYLQFLLMSYKIPVKI